jgi:hypothetical protein
MTNDIDWTTEMLTVAETKSYQDLITWIGTTLEIQEKNSTHLTYLLTPSNERISKAYVNIKDNVLYGIYLQGDNYFLPFEYLYGLSKEYKTAFNTYDSIDDEQFAFYPTNTFGKLNGIDSWIEKELQSLPHKEVTFKNVSFHFDKSEIPYHFRDGWHFINPEAYSKQSTAANIGIANSGADGKTMNFWNSIKQWLGLTNKAMH